MDVAVDTDRGKVIVSTSDKWEEILLGAAALSMGPDSSVVSTYREAVEAPGATEFELDQTEALLLGSNAGFDPDLSEQLLSAHSELLVAAHLRSRKPS